MSLGSLTSGGCLTRRGTLSVWLLQVCMEMKPKALTSLPVRLSWGDPGSTAEGTEDRGTRRTGA